MRIYVALSILLIILLCVTFANGAATYYVKEAADGGNDGGNGHDGSAESLAWATINYAVQNCDGTTPITIYVKQATDAVHSEPARVLTDASCSSKDVTIEGYTTTPGDGAVGSTVVQIASGYLDGIVVNHTAGSLTFRYLDLTNTEANGGTDSLYNPQTNQTSTTFDSCILRRSAEQSANGALLMSYQSGIAPTRTFAMTDCQIVDYTSGAHTAGLFAPGEWATFTVTDCTFSGAPAGGIAYGFQFIYTCPLNVFSGCTSTLTHTTADQAFVVCSGSIDADPVFNFSTCTMADALFFFADSDNGPKEVNVEDCTIVADGRAFGCGIGVGDPTAAYGTVRFVRNHVTLTSEGSSDHGVAVLKGVSNAIISNNTIIADDADFEWPVVLKAAHFDVQHNVIVAARMAIYCVAGTGTIANNTLKQTTDSNYGVIDLRYNSGGAGEDVWPECVVITGNVIDASSGSECLIIIDDSASYSPPSGSYQHVINDNVYSAGVDGMATIWGTDCSNLAELQAAWVTHSSSGTPRYNDSGSLSLAPIPYVDSTYKTPPIWPFSDPSGDRMFTPYGAWGFRPQEIRK